MAAFQPLILTFLVPTPPRCGRDVEQLYHRAATCHEADDPGMIIAELQGIAFLRTWDGNPDQVAWDTCVEPYRMVRAVAGAKSMDPARLVGRAVEKFVLDVVHLLETADPWEFPEAAARLDWLRSCVRRGRGIKDAIRVGLDACGSLEGPVEAAWRLTRWMRIYLPVAPAMFTARTPDADDVVQHLVALRDRLGPRDLEWFEGVMARVKVAGNITSRQLTHCARLLLQVGAWCALG